MKSDNEINRWIEKSRNGEIPFGDCFYKGFQVALAVTPTLESIPNDTITKSGFFWIRAINTLDRIRSNKLPRKVLIHHDFIEWDRYDGQEFIVDDTILPQQESIVTEKFLIKNEGVENVSVKLFSNNHYAISQFICLLKKSNRNKMKIIKIFLASSSELESERKEFEIFINRENKELIYKNIFIELIVWEDFIDAMSLTRLQNEYNNEIKKSDIFISLFFTKVGIFTAEEFKNAYDQFIKSGKPLVYTYFKDEPIDMTRTTQSEINTRFDFEKILTNLGHFPTKYKNIDDLKYQFKKQLEKVLPNL
jgi:hypothetical protein